jgi:hypothetical protein
MLGKDFSPLINRLNHSEEPVFGGFKVCLLFIKTTKTERSATIAFMFGADVTNIQEK